METERLNDQMQIAQQILDAFRASDWERFAAPLAANVTYEETGTQRRVSDANAYIEICKAWKQAFPDARATVHNVVSSGNTVVQEVVWEGTQDGNLRLPTGTTLPPSGRRITTPASLWLTFQGNQVQEVHHHIDVLTMLQQLGVLS